MTMTVRARILVALLPLALSSCLEPDEMICVEDSPVSSCWVPWEDEHARVMLSCEVEQAIAAGVIGHGFERDLEHWGAVTCYELTSSDLSLCIMGRAEVVLADYGGHWGPVTSSEPASADLAAPPC
jgi:hypothetical protein